jgi:hypothetical protein
MSKHYYDLVMNGDVNGLRKLPKIVRFQLMVVLAYMWSAIFSIGIGSYIFFGTSVLLHTLVLIGIFFTADLFRRYEQGHIGFFLDAIEANQKPKTVHDYYKAQARKAAN